MSDRISSVCTTSMLDGVFESCHVQNNVRVVYYVNMRMWLSKLSLSWCIFTVISVTQSRCAM